MRKRRQRRRNPQTRILLSKDYGEVWGLLVDNGNALVLSFSDNQTGAYVFGTSWSQDDIPYPLLLDLEVFMAGFLGRAKAAKAAKGKAASVRDADFLAAYPALGEFLFAVLDDDGKPRQTATLMLFADGGLVKTLLNDRQTAQSLWAQGTSVDEALADLERRIVDDTSAWRDNQTGKRQR